MNIFEYAEKANGKNKPAGNKKNRSIQLIHYSKINPDKYNDVVYSKSPRFNDDSISTLAESIKIAGEIKEPLIVKKTDIGEYKLIAGHRRRLAVIKLIEEGHEQFAMVPCIIDNSTDNMDRFNLIMTNASQGERTDADKAREVKELNDIINQLIANGEIEAMSARQLRKYISRQLNVSETKVAQYNNINNNLNEAAKEEFKNGGIGVSVANELAGLDEASQDELIKEHGDIRSISIKDVKKAKQAKKKIPVIDDEAQAKNIFNALYDEYLCGFSTYIKYLKNEVRSLGIESAVNKFWNLHSGQGQELPDTRNNTKLPEHARHNLFGYSFPTKTEENGCVSMWHGDFDIKAAISRDTFIKFMFEKADIVLSDKPKPSLFFPKIDESSYESVGGDSANSQHDNSSPAGLLGNVSESDTGDDEPIPGQMSFNDYPGVVPVSARNVDNADYSIKKIDSILNKSFLCFNRQSDTESLIAIFTKVEDAFDFCTKKEIMAEADNEYYYKAMPEADTEAADKIFYKGKIDIQGGGLI